MGRSGEETARRMRRWLLLEGEGEGVPSTAVFLEACQHYLRLNYMCALLHDAISFANKK